MKQATHWHWSSASRTDVGAVRELNEDAILELPDRGLWVVADGMGGHAAGDFASGAVVSGLASIPQPEDPGDFLTDVRQCLQMVNRQLGDEARNRHEQVIGSTVVALLLFAGHGVVVWAGDSRAYRFRQGELTQLTRDHSHVDELVSLGLITPQEAEGHPAANVITRAVGAAGHLDLDTETLAIEKGDRFLLCSDGLYRELDADEIKAGLALHDCRQSCDALVDAALARGARDNVSVVVVRVEDD